MKKQILLISICLAGLTVSAQVSKSVNISAGGLLTALTTTELHTVTNLTVTGIIDARDFKTMRDSLTLLSSLDISNVTIASYAGTEGTKGISNIVYPANEIPIFAFFIFNKSIGKTSLVSVVMPLSTTTIGSQAFYYCSGLTGITIPSLVTSIGSQAFYGCSNITSITIPGSVTTLESQALNFCTKLNTITVENGNLNYSSLDGVLFNKDQTILILYPSGKTGISYSIPATATSIGDHGFQACNSLTIITIPSSVVSIETCAFSFSPTLNAINVESANQNYTDIEGVLFDKNQTTLIQYPQGKLESSYIIPATVRTINDYAFFYCTNLTTVETQVSLITIGNFAFYHCSGLTSITIPASVTSLGSQAFSFCSGLTSINVYSPTPIDLSSTGSVFNNVNKSTCTLYVPSGSKSLYNVANQWKDFTNILEFTTAVSSVSDGGSLQIYPNPITNGFFVKGLEEDAILTIIDLNGRTLVNKKITKNEYVPIQTLTKGIYTLMLVGERRNMIQKIIKQ
ncbi:MAG: leucine-rich repeat domain-containing protein [Paludibacter sp.]|jgi:hypothetical protein